ncbi:uncharacterized protein B0T15DRAFT_51304 [Chaetomium strumarium]|uniref:RBR-type E3 ubiquitin transferase n=1 Tax=Chaetomium strumarium TaxID=1170767 RepID=A0AAJ0H2U8_9PEZI|nr:hypothetical protein B0T15DRAFT_51304 [Chaetomium strumarium]
MPRRLLLLPAPVDGLIRPPELDAADYISQVLNRSDGATEADIDQELIAKAVALGVELPISRRNSAQEPRGPGSDSGDTPNLQHTRTASVGLSQTADMDLASQTSNRAPAAATMLTETSDRRRPKSLSFSQYDRYIRQVDPALDQPKFLKPNRQKPRWSTGARTKSGSRKGVMVFTRSLARRLRKRGPGLNTPMPCICCREDFVADNDTLLTLPCGHSYCRECLSVLVTQSLSEERKMPPRCCTQPIPSVTIKMVLPRDKQQQFLKAVVQYSTPWEARIFCPNASCGEFIPRPSKADPKHPFEVVCTHCKTRVCSMCKQAAHQVGQDCPADHESERVLEMGEKSGWRRCYKCRMLVELAQGCTHMTCRCKAQFCYICGAVWDPAVGCPNFCNGEEELERRRAEEEARLAELEAEKAAREQAAEAAETARQEAEKRTRDSVEFGALRKQLEAEMTRFRKFEGQVGEAMRLRQSNKKLALVEKFSDLADKMRERHAKTEQHLEDRQVLVEIELQAQLKEKEKSVKIKLKYMQDYCNGTVPPTGNGDGNNGEMLLRRVVTDRDWGQLRLQYQTRDEMERRHQSQINGLREKQDKSMEELLKRHGKEIQTLMDRRAEEFEDLAIEFANEEEVLQQTFSERRARLQRRWELAVEILRVELEKKHGKKFATMPLPKWPEATDTDTDTDTAVVGETNT